MAKLVLGILGLSFWGAPIFAEDQIIEVPPVGEVTKCRLQLAYPTERSAPRGILLVMDGENLPSDRFFHDERWREFARTQNLVLCGAEMHSETSRLRAHEGYYDASRGAGEMLLDAFEEAGLRGLPIYAYGFSGGARFVGSFVAWKPQAIAAWSAFSASRWIVPSDVHDLPPGIIACGLLDSVRLGASQAFFQEMRSKGQAITWISIQDLGHNRSIPLEEFTRAFFATVPPADAADFVTVDIVKETLIEPAADWQYLLSCQLPAADLIDPWRELNTP